MVLYGLLIDILKYTIAGVGVVYIAFYLFKPYLEKAQNLQVLEFKKAVSNQTLPLRLQAYERLVLFIERINPANLLIRLNGNGYSAAELHSLIINEIRTEYQHNVAQQIYVSARAWSILQRVKDDTINMTTNAIKGLPADATGLNLGRVILTHLATLEDNPYNAALNLIKADMDELF